MLEQRGLTQTAAAKLGLCDSVSPGEPHTTRRRQSKNGGRSSSAPRQKSLDLHLERAQDFVASRARVIGTALYFIAGFTVVFTASGALAGLAGEKIQSSGIMEYLNRPLAITAGVGIVILGL